MVTRAFRSRLAIALLSVPAPAIAADVTLTIHGANPGEGELRVAVCDEATFLKEVPCPKQVARKAAANPETITIVEVPPGQWAVSISYDLNGNQRLDRNFLGIPSEPYGFSRNPSTAFGPPSFQDAAVEIRADPVSLEIGLK